MVSQLHTSGCKNVVLITPARWGGCYAFMYRVLPRKTFGGLFKACGWMIVVTIAVCFQIQRAPTARCKEHHFQRRDIILLCSRVAAKS